MNEVFIDGKKAVLGRLASFAAKQALLGKKVFVVNCNEILIAGNPRVAIEDYKARVVRGGSSLRGPIIIRTPERITKKTIRGMLSYTQGRGEAALDRIRCFNVVPAEYESKKKISFESHKKIKTITLKELCKEI